MSSRKDFIVVGGGIAGLAVALNLAKHGYKVAVYDQGRLEDSATAKAAGILTFQMPPPFVDWAVETLNIYRGMRGSDEGLKDVGALLFSVESGCVERIKRWISSYNLKAYSIDASRAESIAGVELHVERDEEILYTSEFLVDIGWLLNTYQKLLSEYDAEVRYGVSVSLSDNEVIAGGVKIRGEVVVAAGSWTPILLPELKDKLIMYRCQVASVKGVKLGVIIEDDVSDYYASPAGSNSILLGDGSNTRLTEPNEGYKPDMWETYELMEKLARRIKGVEETYPESVWSAPCVAGRDGFPVAGAVSEGLYVIAGFNGVGISLAPAVAERVADVIRGVRKISEMLDPHREIKAVLMELPEPYRFC